MSATAQAKTQIPVGRVVSFVVKGNRITDFTVLCPVCTELVECETLKGADAVTYEDRKSKISKGTCNGIGYSLEWP